MRPQTIQIYLPHGDPQGLRVAEITTRTVQVFDIPRTELQGFFALPESNQVAVYYLFSDESDDSRTQCYVGQTGTAGRRLKQHLDGKAFWTRALVAVSRTNTQTETHARYLEWKSIEAGHDSGRYRMENSNGGSRPHTPAPLEAECEEIFETIDTLLSTLGYPVFKPLASVDPKATDIRVFCDRRGAKAEGIYSDDGLTVVKGSRCRALATGSTTPGQRTQRARLLAEGILIMDGDSPVFAQDYLFKTPSGASQAVLFAPTNGWTEWRTADGTTLHDATGRGQSEPDEHA
ncbi:MAG: GIY-YIG nuclease family protein [Gammaproteobacteria bacterium]